MSNAWNTPLESGLLDDYDFTITRAFFAPDSRYNNGESMLLQLEGKTDDADTPETHQWIPVGKGWISKDGGKSIVHESGNKDKYFMKSSVMGKLITRCVDDLKIGDVLARDGATPKEARAWVGLTLHMKSEELDFGTGMKPQTRTFPNRFVGVKDGAPKASAPAAAAPVATLREQALEAMRPFVGDFTAAQTAALDIPGVTDDEELVQLLISEDGLYGELVGA